QPRAKGRSWLSSSSPVVGAKELFQLADEQVGEVHDPAALQPDWTFRRQPLQRVGRDGYAVELDHQPVALEADLEAIPPLRLATLRPALPRLTAQQQRRARPGPDTAVADQLEVAMVLFREQGVARALTVVAEQVLAGVRLPVLAEVLIGLPTLQAHAGEQRDEALALAGHLR